MWTKLIILDIRKVSLKGINTEVENLATHFSISAYVITCILFHYALFIFKVNSSFSWSRFKVLLSLSKCIRRIIFSLNIPITGVCSWPWHHLYTLRCCTNPKLPFIMKIIKTWKMPIKHLSYYACHYNSKNYRVMSGKLQILFGL